jgi:hypothetical protein
MSKPRTLKEGVAQGTIINDDLAKRVLGGFGLVGEALESLFNKLGHRKRRVFTMSILHRRRLSEG